MGLKIAFNATQRNLAAARDVGKLARFDVPSRRLAWPRPPTASLGESSGRRADFSWSIFTFVTMRAILESRYACGTGMHPSLPVCTVPYLPLLLEHDAGRVVNPNLRLPTYFLRRSDFSAHSLTGELLSSSTKGEVQFQEMGNSFLLTHCFLCRSPPLSQS